MEEHLPFFILENENHPFPLQMDVLSKMKDDIALKFFGQHSYKIISSKATNDDVEKFIYYLVNGKLPSLITEGFLSLSSEILKKTDFSLIQQLNDPNIIDKSNIINIIANNLDQFLIDYGEELMNSSIQLLYTIFTNSKLNNHELAYHLIVSQKEKNNDTNIFILLQFLNVSKLKKETILECIAKRKERNNFMPDFSPSFFENIEEKQNENLTKFDLINQKITNLERIVTNQNQKIEDLERIISNQNEVIENLKQKINEFQQNQNVSQRLQEIDEKLNQQQFKCATKLSISGNQVNIENDNGNVISSISIPSIIQTYNFGSNSGYIRFSNSLLIQWGRYNPPNWCSYGVSISFPIQFSSTPFVATTGGPGADYHPYAIKITNKSFETGYDHGSPTNWIAIGS